MGLDMYLTRKYYVKNWDHNIPEMEWDIKINRGLSKSPINTKKICYIETEEAYWRKANQIHNWFVKNVQGGVDDCRTADVAKEDLKILLKLVRQVLKKHSLASELLPTAQGFFFGGNGYDSYYFDDLKYTRDALTPLLEEKDCSGYFQYHSSW